MPENMLIVYLKKKKHLRDCEFLRGKHGQRFNSLQQFQNNAPQHIVRAGVVLQTKEIKEMFFVFPQTHCCARVVLIPGCVYFLELVCRAKRAFISHCQDSSSVCPAVGASTPSKDTDGGNKFKSCLSSLLLTSRLLIVLYLQFHWKSIVSPLSRWILQQQHRCGKLHKLFTRCVDLAVTGHGLVAHL